MSLTGSEYLRPRRQRTRGPRSEPVTADRERILLAAVAVAATLAVLASLLVAYLSVNAVTHPATLALQATHLSPWLHGGTLRVMALVACTCSVGASCAG